MVFQIFFHHRECWTSLKMEIEISTEACAISHQAVRTSYHTRCTKPFRNTCHSHYGCYLPLLFVITTNSGLHNDNAKGQSSRYGMTRVSNCIFDVPISCAAGLAQSIQWLRYGLDDPHVEVHFTVRSIWGPLSSLSCVYRGLLLRVQGGRNLRAITHHIRTATWAVGTSALSHASSRPDN